MLDVENSPQPNPFSEKASGWFASFGEQVVCRNEVMNTSAPGSGYHCILQAQMTTLGALSVLLNAERKTRNWSVKLFQEQDNLLEWPMKANYHVEKPLCLPALDP